MTRQELVEKIREAKRARGLSWEAIARRVGRHKVWTAAALLGQHPMSAEEAQAAAEVLGLDREAVALLQEYPMRGTPGQAVPVDPTIYRFYEIVQLYGAALKELIHEEFGDGIMSAVDLEVDVRRQVDPHGDRVVVTFSGKFLPYRRF